MATIPGCNEVVKYSTDLHTIIEGRRGWGALEGNCQLFHICPIVTQKLHIFALNRKKNLAYLWIINNRIVWPRPEDNTFGLVKRAGLGFGWLDISLSLAVKLVSNLAGPSFLAMYSLSPLCPTVTSRQDWVIPRWKILASSFATGTFKKFRK